MVLITEEYAKRFHELFQRSKYSKFEQGYAIDTCNVPKEPNMCLVLQLDKKTNKMGMTLLGREAAEVFSILSPINENLIRQYKHTEEFKEKRKLYV